MYQCFLLHCFCRTYDTVQKLIRTKIYLCPFLNENFSKITLQIHMITQREYIFTPLPYIFSLSIKSYWKTLSLHSFLLSRFYTFYVSVLYIVFMVWVDTFKQGTIKKVIKGGCMVDLRIYNQIAFSKVNFGKYHWYKKDKYFFLRIQN